MVGVRVGVIVRVEVARPRIGSIMVGLNYKVRVTRSAIRLGLRMGSKFGLGSGFGLGLGFGGYGYGLLGHSVSSGAKGRGTVKA